MTRSQVEYRHNHPLDPLDVVRVFDNSGIKRPTNDLPRIARANKILDLARAYGIEVSEFSDDPVHVPAPSDTYHY